MPDSMPLPLGRGARWIERHGAARSVVVDSYEAPAVTFVAAAGGRATCSLELFTRIFRPVS